jgi:crotonobetainyl-CoA:carnitine CoA-transferase CaiB-like acyl-CoA transferase
LVYLSVSGFGQTGPYATRPAYEWVGSAFGGLTFLTGFPDKPPVMPGIAITDHTGALFGALGALEAVRRRDAAGAEGRGTHVDCSLYEPIIRMSNAWLTSYSHSGEVQQREGSIPSGQSAPHSNLGYVYLTSDGRGIANFPATRPQFERLCEAIGRPDLIDDPLFADDSDRMGVNFSLLDQEVRAWTAERSFAEVMEAFVEADQPVAPVNGPVEIFEDEHIAFRGNLVPITTHTGHEISIPGVLPHLADDPGGIRWVAEPLGASNHDIYGGLLGMSDQQVGDLERDGVI